MSALRTISTGIQSIGTGTSCALTRQASFRIRLFYTFPFSEIALSCNDGQLWNGFFSDGTYH